MEEVNVKKRGRDELAESPEVKKLRENLLASLEDESESCTSSHDLVVFMKTFEEELVNSPAPVESQPELGYLLDASEDDLGIPPMRSPPADRTEPESTEMSAELCQVGSFAFEETDDSFDGLFEYSDMGFWVG